MCGPLIVEIENNHDNHETLVISIKINRASEFQIVPSLFHTHTNTHPYTYHTHTNTHARTHIHKHTYTHTHIHTHTHTHTHTHSHTHLIFGMPYAIDLFHTRFPTATLYSVWLRKGSSHRLAESYIRWVHEQSLFLRDC